MYPARPIDRPLAAILLGAAALRIAVVWTLQTNLTDDRDAYLALARQVSAGHGFSVPGSDPPLPTAYRPPLYPLMLAPLHSSPLAVGLLQAALGTWTVGLTWTIARRRNLAPWQAAAAAMFVAADPLLLQYTSFPMTETLCTFSTAALLAVALPAGANAVPRSRSRQVALGALFGLGVLCRPTLWAYAVCVVVAWIWQRLFSRDAVPSGRRPAGASGLVHGVPWLTLIAAAAFVAPWMLRNWFQLGSPVVTTTHGGYTLLLGNNPAFYREVVDQPLGTVWDGSHGPGQAAWAEEIQREMALAGAASEVERDRWMSRRAWRHILEQPGLFGRACLLRLIRFWNVVPSGPAAEGLPPIVWYAVGAWYLVVFALALRGLWRSWRSGFRPWLPLVLLIAGFTAVHLLYWSNVRMRAPVMPAVAVLAAFGLGSRSQRSQLDRSVTPRKLG